MALRLADVLEEMRNVLATTEEEAGRARQDTTLELAAAFLVKALARDVEMGQAAILRRDRKLDLLTFAYPLHLSHGNAIPVDRNSIAGRIVLSKVALIENNVPDEPHKAFFERIPDTEGRVRAIQKMVAAPLLDRNGEAIGVIEVSRTGGTAAESGPDFTSRDGDNLTTTCRAFAPLLARLWTSARG